MSYRNDHDATLARVDALEAELTRLRAENARLSGESQRSHSLPPPRPAAVQLYGEPEPEPRRTKWIAALRLVAFLLAGVRL